ncbi:MAG: DUF1801 domain-containing protein [Planctomycetes bacterium]|nr:DUF1801 domain-containing protein [Planctomycetota bacterium]
MPQRLNCDQIAQLFQDWPDEACDLALELRDLVLEIAPELDETIAFKALCYHKPGHAYGRIGGNVCMIGPDDECLHLGFIHGAALPDPGRLLQGNRKAKRHIPIHSASDINRRAFTRLIRAAIAYDPTDT